MALSLVGWHQVVCFPATLLKEVLVGGWGGWVGPLDPSSGGGGVGGLSGIGYSSKGVYLYFRREVPKFFEPQIGPKKMGHPLGGWVWNPPSPPPRSEKHPGWGSSKIFLDCVFQGNNCWAQLAKFSEGSPFQLVTLPTHHPLPSALFCACVQLWADPWSRPLQCATRFLPPLSCPSLCSERNQVAWTSSPALVRKPPHVERPVGPPTILVVSGRLLVVRQGGGIVLAVSDFGLVEDWW